MSIQNKLVLLTPDHTVQQTIETLLIDANLPVDFHYYSVPDEISALNQPAICLVDVTYMQDKGALHQLKEALNNPRFIPILDDCGPDRIHQLLAQGIEDYLLRTQLDAISLKRAVRLALNSLQPAPDSLQYVVDKSTGAILVLNDDGDVLFANQSSATLFGKPLEELQKLTLGVPLTANNNYEIEIVNDELGIIVAEMNISSFSWEGQPVYLASLHDVTDRWRMTHALREAEALNVAILNSMQVIIAVVDESGTIIKINDAWKQFAMDNGDPELKATGLGINYFDVLRKSAGKKESPALAGMLEVLDGKRDSFELKYPCHSPVEERWFLMRVTPLRHSDRRGLVVSHINISIQQAEARQNVKNAIELERGDNFTRQRESYRTFGDEELIQPIPPHEFDDYRAIYANLLDSAIERRTYKVAHDVSRVAKDLAYRLGKQSAKPRDLVNLHVRVLDEKINESRKTTKRYVYEEEGRILLLELMGYLASFYRENLLTHLELHNM